VSINQHVKLRVDVILAHGLIHGLPIELGLLHLLHFAPTVLPLLLQLLDVFHHIPAVILRRSNRLLLLLHVYLSCVLSSE
jgi:hypothetical protein